MAKIVTKPWGREIWLALNDKYCYKRIEIKQGFKTSYQYHNFKLETNYIISGEAEIWLENDEGVVEKSMMRAGDFFTVVPPRKHRVIALTDVILQEVSTPEVDDVVRIDDEFNRGDGKIENEHVEPVVCILAAGTGSRMGNLTNNCPKPLLPYKHKAILSHIIDSFSKNVEIVLAVGYLKEHIKEYISFFHSDRKITFVDVDRYEGKGSGPAYSVLLCKEKLQRPFYFCVSDFYTSTKIENEITGNNNWIGIAETQMPEMYSTLEITDGKIVSLINKSPGGHGSAFTGIFYMQDYKLFWEQFHLNVDGRFEVVDIFKNITIFNFDKKYIDWKDMGTLDSYNAIACEPHLYNIKNEFKYMKDGIFIKKIEDPTKISSLFKRGDYLREFIPKMIKEGKYFYSYEYFEGSTLYSIGTRKVYAEFLKWFEVNFCGAATGTVKEAAMAFYKQKTLDRLSMLKTGEFSALDSIEYINSEAVKPISYYIDKVNWDDLIRTSRPTPLFHGDLQFDNIVYNGSEFKLIDWRENFGGEVERGDLYYDIAKLYGGMILNYNKMKDDQNYSYQIVGTNKALLNHYRDPVLWGILESEFSEFLDRNGFDIDKVKRLVALIFINMAPLHVNNFDKFLFLKAKMMFKECETVSE